MIHSSMIHPRLGKGLATQSPEKRLLEVYDVAVR